MAPVVSARTSAQVRPIKAAVPNYEEAVSWVTRFRIDACMWDGTRRGVFLCTDTHT